MFFRPISVPRMRFCPETLADVLVERWFKDGVDVNKVEISEAHW